MSASLCSAVSVHGSVASRSTKRALRQSCLAADEQVPPGWLRSAEATCSGPAGWLSCRGARLRDRGCGERLRIELGKELRERATCSGGMDCRHSRGSPKGALKRRQKLPVSCRYNARTELVLHGAPNAVERSGWARIEESLELARVLGRQDVRLCGEHLANLRLRCDLEASALALETETFPACLVEWRRL